MNVIDAVFALDEAAGRFEPAYWLMGRKTKEELLRGASPRPRRRKPVLLGLPVRWVAGDPYALKLAVRARNTGRLVRIIQAHKEREEAING